VRRAELAYKKAITGTHKPITRSNDGDISMADAIGDGIDLGGDIELIDGDDDAPEDLTEQVQHQFDALILIVSNRKFAGRGD